MKRLREWWRRVNENPCAEAHDVVERVYATEFCWCASYTCVNCGLWLESIFDARERGINLNVVKHLVPPNYEREVGAAPNPIEEQEET